MAPTRLGSVEWPPKKKIVFSEEVKEVLRKPAGKLITGDPDEVAEKIAWIIEEENPPIVVAVGDYTSRKLSEKGIRVNLYIVDGRIERRPAEQIKLNVDRVERVVNEPGTISPEAASKIHSLLRRKRLERVLLLVEGEEDLLTLAAILSAPDRALIIYGQPKKGSVIVKVGDKVRELAHKVLAMLER